jgi:hypothetical protein
MDCGGLNRVQRADGFAYKAEARNYFNGDDGNGIPLEDLPAEPVIRAFDAFAEEFLPKAFAWRGEAVEEASRPFLQNRENQRSEAVR